jgi:predicted outer membrane repeat protein
MAASFKALVRQLFHRSSQPRNPSGRRAHRLRCEQLEDRVTPATFTVTNTADSGAGSLRWAVAQANATAGADVIDFSVTGTITLTTGVLSLTDTAETAIQGPGVSSLTVSGNNASQIFNVTGAAVLANMTLTQGRATNGGAVASTGQLTVTGCAFTSNSATTSGGAIYDASSSPASVTNCTFTSNRTSDSTTHANFGGAIANVSTGTLTVANCTFDSNLAAIFELGNGGAIFNGAGASMVLANSTLINNTCVINGGAIDNAGTLTVLNSLLQDNTAGSSSPRGGGIANESSGTLSVISSTITECAAYLGAGIYNEGNLEVTASTLSSNTSISGGAIFNTNGGSPTRTTTVTACWIADNIASTNGGGGILNGSGTITISTTTFTGNYAADTYGYTGGAILNQSAGTINVSYSTFNNNRASNGAGIDNFGSLTVSHSNFTGNNSYITGGGAIFNEGGATANISNSTFVNNRATTGGGALVNSGTMTITDSAFTSNTSPSGGAINAGGTFTVTGSTFTSNRSNRGGAILGGGTITGCTFSGNSAFQDHGGAFLNGGTSTVTNCVFSDNTAPTNGGAIFNPGGNLTVTGSTFNGNTATHGGGIYNQTTLSVTGSTFNGNTATTNGGGIFSNSSLTVNQSTFNSNTAAWGGGILSTSTPAPAVVTNSTFSRNSATNGGGGISAAALKVVNSTFNGNTAADGGGIGSGSGGGGGTGSGGGGGSPPPPPSPPFPPPPPPPPPGGTPLVTVTACTISGNSATTSGGGIKGFVLLDSSIVAGNAAPTGPDISGSAATGSSYNLVGNGSGVTGLTHGVNNNQVGTSGSPINPLLTQLGFYGGPTPTMALQSGSPAIGTGNPNSVDANGNPLTTDQRGFARPNGTGATPAVGAFAPQTYTHFVVTAQQYTVAGSSFTVTVAAVDQFNNRLTSYTGTVQFISSDANASLPPNYTFTVGDQGMHTFTVTLNTAGTQTVPVTDTVTSSATGSATLSVAPVLTVTNTNDTGYGSLRWAVAQANALTGPNTITFSPGVFGTPQTITLTSGPLTLADAALTTIQGPGASLLTVSGNNADRVFVVNLNAAAAISGMTVSQGVATSGGRGGAIDNTGTLSVSNATVSNNTGNGVFNSGSLALVNTAVTGNSNGGILNTGSLTVTGGSVSSNSGANRGIFNSGSAAVFSSTISGNAGGNIFNGGTLSVTASTVSSTSSVANGAGIFNSGTATVSTSTLNGNAATLNGGGIFSDGTLTVVSSTLNGNSAVNGGGIFSNGTLTVTAGTISGNSATNGGGIFNLNPLPNSLTLNSTIVAGNTAASGADVFGAIAPGSSFNLVGGSPGLNPLANNGGPTQTMSLQPGSPAINAGDPNATDANGNLLRSDQRGSARPHGAGQTPDIGAYDTHGTVATNRLALSLPTTTFPGQSFTFTVTALDSSGNVVTGYSGTVQFTSSDGSAVLPPGSTLTNGVGTFTATLNTLGIQTIAAADHTFGILPIVGGVIVNPLPTFLVTSTSDPDLTPNLPPVAGTLRWAVAQANATKGPAVIAFDSSFWSSAHTITLTAANGPLTLLNTTSTKVVGPGASLLTVSGGNAVQVMVVGAGAVASIDGLTISQGVARTTSTFQWWEDGTGILSGGALTLTNSTLSGNGTGNAVLNSGSLTMSGDTVTGNTGRGVFNAGTLALTGSTVSNNSAALGGGVFNSGTATVATSTISGNTTGGGVYNTGTLAVGSSTVSGNTSSRPGGGIANTGLLMLTLSTLGGNTSSSLGGGVENFGTAVVTASTLSNNTGTRGSGIDNRGTLTLDSALVAANVSSADIWGGAAVTSGFNLIGNGSDLLNLTNGVNNNQVGTSGSPIDPLLGPLANNGGPTQTFALLTGSPALNTGNSNAKDPGGNLLTADQRGFTRPVGQADIGAYEDASGEGESGGGGMAPLWSDPDNTGVVTSSKSSSEPSAVFAPGNTRATPASEESVNLTGFLFVGPDLASAGGDGATPAPTVTNPSADAASVFPSSGLSDGAREADAAFTELVWPIDEEDGSAATDELETMAVGFSDLGLTDAAWWRE